jgi:hypothetical protein
MVPDDRRRSKSRQIPLLNQIRRLFKLALFAAPVLLVLSVGGAMVFADSEGGDDAPNIDTTISHTSTSGISGTSGTQTLSKK